MASWVSRAGWQSTEPVDRFKTLLDQTMTISVAGPPGGDPAQVVDAVVDLAGRGDGGRGTASPPHDGDGAPADAGTTSARIQTRWGLPDVTLTDPLTLGSVARLAFAGLCAFVLLAALGAVIALAAGGTEGTAAYVVLGIVAATAMAGMVVLVMGLRSLTIGSGAQASG